MPDPTYGPPVQPARRSLPRWAKVLLWIAGILSAAFLALILFVAAMLNGGLDDLFNRPGPFETDPKVVKAKEAGHRENREDLDAYVAGPVRQAVDPATVAGRATSHDCEVGQHGWKRDDPFDLRCRLSDAVIIVGDVSTFRQDMMALHDSIVAEGTFPEPEYGMDVADVIRDYWDSRDASVGVEEAYTPGRLPSAKYETPNWDRALHISWLSSARETWPGNVPLDTRFGEVRIFAPDGTELTDQEAATLITGEGAYGLVIEIERIYFDK